MQLFFSNYGIISIGDIYMEENQYFEYIIKEYSDMVFRLAISRTGNKEHAEDIYQEVFLRLAKRNPKFENKEHEKAWLIKVTINCTKNFWNANTYLKNLEELKEEIKFETKEKSEAYYAVMELSKQYRTIIYLYYYEKYKISEISKILNIKEGTIKSRISKS